ncbi:MAG: carboxymuconolactone decarboxylase family protein [Thermoflexales bacterium]|nr:carboxymuconolactone decarboxylase family protein [Thermoflexales bacterium]
MNECKRRTYHSLSQVVADLKAVMARRDRMKPLMRGKLIDAAFRERLMLAVTAVNGCRYCSYVHARHALVEGMSSEEVKALQTGELANSPPEELAALLYAQHWAETRGKPDPAARGRVTEQYGEEKVEAIELTLRTIQMANLLMNTLDYALYRLSFGRWGSS